MAYNSINTVILSGFIGSDPEIRVLESGVKLAKFSLATSENYIDNQGLSQCHTQWHSIVCWRTTASYAEYNLSRGSLVRIEGKLRTISPGSNYGSTQNYGYEIIASTVQLLSNDAVNKSKQKSTTTYGKSSNLEENLEIESAPQDVDGIPF